MKGQFDYLKDIRTFEKYKEDVEMFTRVEEKFSKYFECLLRSQGHVIWRFENGCEKKKLIFFEDTKDISFAPDYEFNIDGVRLYVEVKCCNLDIKYFHLKKWQLDKFFGCDLPVVILFVMNHSLNPHLAIIPIHKVVEYPVVKLEQFGRKECYKLKKDDFVWLYVNDTQTPSFPMENE